jgi:hypothetical protein
MNRIIDNREYKQRGILYLPEHINALKMHPNETLDHWITKAIVFRLLRKMKHEVVTEFEITGMGVGDVLDLTNSVQYEIETTSYPKYIQDRAKQYARTGVDVITIPVGKLPKDIKERYKELKKWVLE